MKQTPKLHYKLEHKKKHKLLNSNETPGKPPTNVDDKKHKLEHKKEAQEAHNCFVPVEHKKSTNSQTPPQTGAQKGAQKTHNCFVPVEHKKGTNSQTQPQTGAQKKHKKKHKFRGTGAFGQAEEFFTKLEELGSGQPRPSPEAQGCRWSSLLDAR